MAKGDFLMAEIEVNRSCVNGLNKSSCLSLSAYIQKVKSMEVDYNESYLMYVINNS